MVAPSAGDFMKRRANGRRSRWARAGSSAPKVVLTTPGCTALAVTAVPSSRLANSQVNRTLASMDGL